MRARAGAFLAERLTPERTRRATWFERQTVQRLSWEHVVILNRYLELTGKVATVLWAAFVASFVLGFDWRDAVELAINSGKPVAGAVVLAIIVPTLLFLVARSAVGFGRWRLQRELWRRDVARLERWSATPTSPSGSGSQYENRR